MGRGVRRTTRTAASDGAADAATVDTTSNAIQRRTCRLHSRACFAADDCDSTPGMCQLQPDPPVLAGVDIVLRVVGGACRR